MPTVRIIAGRWRSRRLDLPPSKLTRPMTDRVKEALFDILGARLGTPGQLPPVWVLDIFAGSGAMGLEAVSRGATGCVFVERAKASRHILQANLDALQAGPTLSLVAADAWRYRWEAVAKPEQRFGLVVVDPPYRDARDTSPTGKVPRLLDRLAIAGVLTDDALLVLHHEKAVRFPESLNQAWLTVDCRDYGRTAITFMQPNMNRRGCQPATAVAPKGVNG